MTENILNPKLPLLNLDIQKQQEWAAPAQLMTQGDKGYVQPFTLSQNWEKYQVDTTSLGLRFSKPDGNIYDSSVTTSGIVTETGLTSAGFKTYEIELPKELTQVPGTVTAYIYAANSAGTIVASSNRFTYQVLPEFSADPASTTYIKGLDEIRDQLDDYLNKIKTLSDSYGADKDAIVANLKKQAQQWLSQEQDELSNQLTAEQQKLSDLSQKYTDKYNELINQLPDADSAITQKINAKLAEIEQQAQDALKGLDLSNYELKSDLAEKLSAINTSLEKAISIDDVNRALASYATKADLDKKADKAELASYATKDELKAIQPGTPDLSGYETKSDHANDINGIRDALENKANTSDLATYETKADAKKALDAKANTADLATYATKTDLATKADTTALAGYATKTDLDAKANVSDLATYETKADAKKALDAKANVSDLATYATKDDLKTIQPGAPDLSGYETTSAHQKDIDGINEALKGKADVASLSDLATKADLDEKANKTDIPDTSQFATKTDLDTKADKTVLAGYATKTDLDTKADKTALDAKANTSDLTVYETKEDAKKALDTKANAADLAAYATKTDLAAKADTTVLAGYATKDDLKNVKPSEPDLSGYETKDDHKKDIDGINDALKGKADVASLSNLATKAEIANKADEAELDEKADKSEIPDTSQFIKQIGVNGQIANVFPGGFAQLPPTIIQVNNNQYQPSGYNGVIELPDYPDTSNLATKDDLNAKADKTELTTFATKDDLAKVKPDETDLSGYEKVADHKKDIDGIRKALDDKADVSDLSTYATKDELNKPQPFIDERNTPYAPNNGQSLTKHGELFEEYVMPQGPDAINSYAGRYLNSFNKATLSYTFDERILNGLIDGSFNGYLQGGTFWEQLQVGKIWTTPFLAGFGMASIVAGVNCLGDQITSADGKKTYKNYVVMLGLANVSQMGQNIKDSSFKITQYAGKNLDISNYNNLATLEKPDTSINTDAKAGDGALTFTDPFSEVTADIGAYLKAAYGDYLGTIRKNIFTGYYGDDGFDGSPEFYQQSQYKNYYAQLLNQKMIYGQDMINSIGTQTYYRLNIDSDWQQLPLFRMQSKAIDNISRVLDSFNFWLRDLSITRPKDDDNSSTVIRPVLVNNYANDGFSTNNYSYPAPYVADANNHVAPVVFYYVLVNPNEK